MLRPIFNNNRSNQLTTTPVFSIVIFPHTRLLLLKKIHLQRLELITYPFSISASYTLVKYKRLVLQDKYEQNLFLTSKLHP